MPDVTILGTPPDAGRARTDSDPPRKKPGPKRPPITDVHDLPLDFLAALFELTERRVRQLIAADILPKPVSYGRYDGPAMVKAWVDYLDAGKEGDQDIAESKRVYWKAKAGREEIALEQAAGRLADVEAMRGRLEEALTRVAQHLDAVPARVAAAIAGMTDAASIRQLLLQEIRDARHVAIQSLLAGRAPRDVPELGTAEDSDA